MEYLMWILYVLALGAAAYWEVKLLNKLWDRLEDWHAKRSSDVPPARPWWV